MYDDYAHHPGELSALLTTARSLGYRRVICAFQPHTYTRTKELFDQFVQVLQLPDKVLLAEIFAARETDTLGISSRDLAQRIPGAGVLPHLWRRSPDGWPSWPSRGSDPDRGCGDIYLAGSACWRTSEARPAADPSKNADAFSVGGVSAHVPNCMGSQPVDHVIGTASLQHSADRVPHPGVGAAEGSGGDAAQMGA